MHTTKKASEEPAQFPVIKKLAGRCAGGPHLLGQRGSLGPILLPVCTEGLNAAGMQIPWGDFGQQVSILERLHIKGWGLLLHWCRAMPN